MIGHGDTRVQNRIVAYLRMWTDVRLQRFVKAAVIVNIVAFASCTHRIWLQVLENLLQRKLRVLHRKQEAGGRCLWGLLGHPGGATPARVEPHVFGHIRCRVAALFVAAKDVRLRNVADGQLGINHIRT